MTERKRTYQSQVQGAALRRLAPMPNPAKRDEDSDLARLISLNPSQADQKIDLLYRLIKHLKDI